MAISLHGIARDCCEKSTQAAPFKEASQEELADQAGINRNYVGMLEREENAATVDMLEKLAEVLDVDPIEFFKRLSRKSGPREALVVGVSMNLSVQ